MDCGNTHLAVEAIEVLLWHCNVRTSLFALPELKALSLTSIAIQKFVASIQQTQCKFKLLKKECVLTMIPPPHHMVVTTKKQISTAVKTLVCRFDFNELIADLPETLESLEIQGTDSRFGPGFNCPVDNLPRFLKRLELDSHSFNHPVDKLPATLTLLTLGRVFNQPVDQLPPNLTYLEFSTNFNRPVNNLPSTLTSLALGFRFNQPLEHLPPHLTSLVFSKFSAFNHSLDALPASIKQLELGNAFNKTVDSLPRSLVTLKFGRNFSQPVNRLPSSVTSLHFGRYDPEDWDPEEADEGLSHFDHPLDNLPPTLAKLNLWGHEFNHPVDSLPSSITKLFFGIRFNQPLDRLPATVLKLSFDCDSHYDHPLDNLPASLKSLVLNDSYNLPLNSLPASLESLYVGGHFNQPLVNLPHSLTSLRLSDNHYGIFDQPLILPPNVREFRMKNFCNKPIGGFSNALDLEEIYIAGNCFNNALGELPESLIRLTLGNAYNHPFVNIPSKLEYLEVGDAFTQPLDQFQFKDGAVVVLPDAYPHPRPANTLKSAWTFCDQME